MNIVITGGGATDLIEWRPDPAIMKIVATWPSTSSRRARPGPAAQ